MANPIPIRPWSFLGSVLSSPAPIPESHHKPQTLPSHPMEPSHKPPQARNTSYLVATKSTPTTHHVQSPMQSQKPNTTPLTFSPSRWKVNPIESKITIEKEAKTVIVSKTIEKANANIGNGNDSLKKESGATQKQGIGQHEKQVITTKENESIHTKLSDPEGSGMRVITIAGENRDAYMQNIQSQKKPISKMGRKDKSQKLRTLS